MPRRIRQDTEDLQRCVRDVRSPMTGRYFWICRVRFSGPGRVLIKRAPHVVGTACAGSPPPRPVALPPVVIKRDDTYSNTMNTIVNHKSEDILQVSWAENPPAAWQGATAQKRRDSKCDCLGVVSGASNRGAPRGARAQKQTNLASDAR